MKSAWGKIVLLAALSCALSLGLVAGQAVAKKHKKTHPVIRQVSTSGVSPAPGSSTTLTATCPKGTRVVGGGYDAPALLNGPQPVVYSSKALLPGAWQIQVTEVNQAGGAISVNGFCEKLSQKSKKAVAAKKKKHKIAAVREISATAPVSAGSMADASATCPGKLRAISGGFAVPQPSIAQSTITVPGDSRRTAPNAWTSSGIVFQGPPSSVTTYAYCANESRSETSGTATIPGGISSSGSVSATPCPRGTTLAGLGFSQAASLSGSGNLLIITESAPADSRTARASGAELVDGSTPLTAYGYCA